MQLHQRSAVLAVNRRLSAVAAMARSGDIRGLVRKAEGLIFGRPPSLRPSLAPKLRIAAEKAAPPPLKKLTLATPSLDLDGAPLSQFEIASGLLARGWQIAICSARDGALAKRYREMGVDVRIEHLLAPSSSVGAWYERDVAALAKRLADLGPGLLFASSIDAFAAIDAARIAGLTSAWNIREAADWRARLADRHEHVAARALAAFSYPAQLLFPSRASLTAWSEFVPEGRGRVIYNAQPPIEKPISERRRLRARMVAGEDDFLIISVGTICENKGQIDIVKALTAAPEELLSRIRLAFVGREDRSYRRKLDKVLPEKLTERTAFVGVADDAAALIAAADVLVNTSRSEAFARTMLEAAAAQTPMIVTPVGGAPERLADRRSCIFYTPGDAKGLLAAISMLADDSRLASALAAAARAELIDGWTRDEMIDAYEAALLEATGARGRNE